MKPTTLVPILLLGLAGAARAELGAFDVVPAATLLVPYFEVDVSGATGRGENTIVTFSTATAQSTIARVTLWTDLGIPTMGFDVYLTGHDQTTLDLRLLFLGGLREVTASAGQDPTDQISPHTNISQDINFALCNDVLPNPQQLPAATREALRLAHMGKASTLLGGKCGARTHGDESVRGYITIDVMNGCTTLFPTDPGYFDNGQGQATNANILTGLVERRHIFQNFAQAEPLVHLEANSASPLTTGSAVTFYRSRIGSAKDNRERLPSEWQARFTTGTAFANDTELLVWRDPGAVIPPFTCGASPAAPFPIPHPALTVYDDTGASMPVGGSLFPFATQRVRVDDDFAVPMPTGVLALDLDTPSAFRQAHVTVIHRSEGRFSTGMTAFPVGGTP